jgi:hypothetical protein
MEEEEKADVIYLYAYMDLAEEEGRTLYKTFNTY